jgi:hypothetical protein
MSFLKQALKYGAVLIGAYIAVEYAATGTVPLLKGGSSFVTGETKTLQGRG